MRSGIARLLWLDTVQRLVDEEEAKLPKQPAAKPDEPAKDKPSS